MTTDQAAGIGFLLMAVLLYVVWRWMGRAERPQEVERYRLEHRRGEK